MGELRRIADVADIVTGHPFKSGDFLDSGQYRLLRGDNIAQGNLRWSGAKWLDEPAVRQAAFALEVGDLVLAMDRPWIEAGLKFARVRDVDLPALLVQRVARLRARPEVLQGFLSCVIGSAKFVEYVKSVQTGSAVPHISAQQIGAFQFSVPTMMTQRAIAEFSEAIDDKVAANSRLAVTADDLAGAHMKRMALLGTERPLSSVARFVNGRNFTKNATGSGRVVVRTAELNAGVTGSTVWNEVDAPSDNVVTAGDILFAWSGTLTLRRWWLDEAVVNQHLFKVIPEPGIPSWLAFQLVAQRMPEYRAIAADKATTMGHIQRKHLDEPVSVPPAEVIEANNGLMSGLWSRALLALRENEELKTLRGALLPQLMSGRITVREAEEVAGL